MSIFSWLLRFVRPKRKLPAPPTKQEIALTQAEVEKLALGLIRDRCYDEVGYMFRIVALPGFGWVSGKSEINETSGVWEVKRPDQIWVEPQHGGSRISLSDFIRAHPKVDLVGILKDQRDLRAALHQAREVFTEIDPL